MSKRDDEYYDRDERRSSHRNNNEIRKSSRDDRYRDDYEDYDDYDEKIGHLALARIELDLDDGVKVNYRKLQTAADGKLYEVLADSKNIMVKEKSY